MPIRPTIGLLICLIAGCQSVGSAMLGTDTGALDENNALAVSGVSAAVDRVEVRDAAGDDSQPTPEYDAILVTAAEPLEPTALAQPPETIAPPMPGGEPTSGDEEASGPSLARLEQIALGNNPALAQAEAQVSALRGKWVQVGLPPNVQIGYIGEDIDRKSVV